MLKKVATILAVILVVGFLLYRINWDTGRKNAPTNEIVSPEILRTSFTTRDLETIENVANEICEGSEIEIEHSFKVTEDLRNKLLNNHIKASSLVKYSSLIPKDLDYRKDDNGQQVGGNGGDVRLKMMEVDTQVPNSKINERTDFTDLPDFFNNELQGARAFPLLK